MRVRGFTQDDAHIFCTPEQVEGEILIVLNFSLDMIRAFGLTEFKAYLSTRPEKSVGEREQENAQVSIRTRTNEKKNGLPFEEALGFIREKIDAKAEI